MIDEKSILMMNGVHRDLVAIVHKAFEIAVESKGVTFRVTEGVRTMDRQKELFNKGASKSMSSRHVPENNLCKMSCAVDVIALDNGKGTWLLPHYKTISDYFKQAAKELGLLVEWGGDWKSFTDGPHFQLPVLNYPKALVRR